MQHGSGGYLISVHAAWFLTLETDPNATSSTFINIRKCTLFAVCFHNFIHSEKQTKRKNATCTTGWPVHELMNI